ncbi:unnamed protein product, partial [Cylicostephanus goldi]
LTLPDAIPCEVVCSSVIDPGHFFLQQPTHPSFSSLSHLDMYMIRLYSQGTDIPDLPKPCQTGLLCAAPVLGAWFRAVTVSYYAETDEVMLRFVDYGGYTRLPRSELRQIRTDLMSLPFQAIECYLAHVQPIDGTWQWGEAAFAHFQKLCMGKVMNATVVGFNVSDKVPMVELTVLDEENKDRQFSQGRGWNEDKNDLSFDFYSRWGPIIVWLNSAAKYLNFVAKNLEDSKMLHSAG